MAPRLPPLGPRTRTVLRYLALIVFALVVFVFALQMTFPYDRVKDKIVDALSDKYEVTIGGVERGIVPGRVYFSAVTLRSRPTKEGETVSTLFIKKLELDAGILPLLSGNLSMDVEAQIGAGTLTASFEIGTFGRGDIHAHVHGGQLPGDALPMKSLLGLPLSGKIEFDVSLHLPMEKSKLGKVAINWQKVAGAFSLGCPTGCTFGDGVTKLKPLLKNTRNQVMVGDGIDFGKITMDSLIAKATIKSGKLTLDKFDVKSKDGELKVDYMMTLEKSFDESVVAGCLRFKGSEDLVKRAPNTYAALTTTGAELRGDGLFHIRLSDRFKDMKRLNQECGAGASVVNQENFGGKPGRPTITTQPEETRTGSAIAAPTPTPMETPTPPPTPTTTPPSDAAVASPTGGSAMPPATGALPDGVPPAQITNDRVEPGMINATGSGATPPATPPPE
jgi:type II secretion system protein N